MPSKVQVQRDYQHKDLMAKELIILRGEIATNRWKKKASPVVC